jgi:GT2 family glycosyltransferase
MINAEQKSMRSKKLSLNTTLQYIAKKALVNFNYLPSYILKKLIGQMKQAEKFYEILTLANIVTSKKNTPIQTKRILITAKVHALLSIRNYKACIEFVDTIGSDISLRDGITPIHYKLLSQKALACTRIGNLNEAEDSLRQAYKLKPSDSKICGELALCLLNKGSIDEAKYLIEKIRDKRREKYILLKYRANLLSNEFSRDFLGSENIKFKNTSDINIAIANLKFFKNDFESGKKHLDSYFSAFNLKSPSWPGHSFPRIEQLRCDSIKPVDDGPLVSVIMTCFNSEETIAFAIESIRNQSYQNLEIFIVDDVSTDNSFSIINDFAKKDPRIKLIKNEKNSGTYVSKNIALLEAKGKYITFHDSDDWHHPHRIERHVQECESHPQILGVYSCCVRLTNNGEFVQQPWLSFLHENPSSLLINRKVFQDIGYFDSVRIAADREFIFRMKAHYGPTALKLLKQPYAMALHHEKSLTRSGAGVYNMHSASPSRIQYWDEYSRWHRHSIENNTSLKIDFPLLNRPFHAPESILP